MNEILFDKLKREFLEIFDHEYQYSYFAPGCVNLIGEHTDYNGGHVFPCAITQGTYGLVRKREDFTIRCYSLNFEDEGIIYFELNQIKYDKSDGWAKYVKGVTYLLAEKYPNRIQGFDNLVYGNIPNGAGLSSSASLELLVGTALNDLFELNSEKLELILIGQKVENIFLGLNTGIMDQFAIGMGQKDHAIFLDVNTLDYEMVPTDLDNCVIMIMNTNKRRELTESEYNERRKECEMTLAKLQEKLEINSLGDLTPDIFEQNKYLINDEILIRRAKHAVYENQRTIEAKKLLTESKLHDFGKLLNESHISLRDDYEVTGVELDTLVEAAWQEPAVIGARMTGAGMGGCAIAIIDKEAFESACQRINEQYIKKVGYDATFYIVEVGDGPKKLLFNEEG